MTFRDIIPISDDYAVAKSKATIAVDTVRWCHEVFYFKARIFQIGRQDQDIVVPPAPRLLEP